MKLLTKSRYILGLECPKYLWLSINHPEKIRKADIAQEFRFEEGDKIGELSKSLFKDGVNIPKEDYLINLHKTKESLKLKKPLFEAGFEFNNCFARVDILDPVKDEWDLIEVKSSTKVKKRNIHDLSFQKFIIESSGIKIRKCFLILINNEYVRKGEIDPEKLFIKKDITLEVNEAVVGIEERINEIFKIIHSSSVPKAGILKERLFYDGSHDCFVENCLELNENHVFCLYRAGKMSYELFENNIIHIKDIPLHIKLNGRQNIQRDCEINNKIFVDKEKVKEFLIKIEYPIHFLDFETFNPAVPMFDGLKPYSQIAFQFSLHILEKENSEPVHHSFLYNGNSDPRKKFISELKKIIMNKGTIIVYNQTFEISILKGLAELYPENKEWTGSILKRIVDLYNPFRDFYYYNSKQQGSASIKDVLPAMTGRSYEGMEIKGGGVASAEFMKIAYDKITEDEKNKIRENLLKYCGLDTMAEVLILTKLRELIKEKIIV